MLKNIAVGIIRGVLDKAMFTHIPGDLKVARSIIILIV